MDWIAGIGRDGTGCLCVKAQGVDGNVKLKELKALRPDLGVPVDIRKKVRLALHDLKVGSSRQYLDDLGLRGLEADGQPVYEILTDAGLLVIPAQLLILASFGANCHVRPSLLRPWGPEFLMNACVEPSEGKLTLRPTPRRMFLLQFERSGITSNIEYALTYPSASAAWSSIYRNALDGRFDMEMPKVVASGMIRARRVNGRLLVTRLRLMTLAPTEDPHPFAAGVAKSVFVLNEMFDNKTTHGKGKAPQCDVRLSDSTGHVAKLTDVQWAQIEQLVQDPEKPGGKSKAGRLPKHSLREVIEVIRLKLGTPFSWTKVTADDCLMQRASNTLLTLKRRGVWEAVVEVGKRL